MSQTPRRTHWARPEGETVIYFLDGAFQVAARVLDKEDTLIRVTPKEAATLIRKYGLVPQSETGVPAGQWAAKFTPISEQKMSILERTCRELQAREAEGLA